MKKIAITFIFLLTVFQLKAQAGWQWPADTTKAKSQWALFQDALREQRYQDGLTPFQWLLREAPTLNPALYINGEKLYKGLIKTTQDAEKKKQYQQEALALYDLRMQHFHQEDAVMNRKAFAAYLYYRNEPEQYPALFSIFEEAAKNGLQHFSSSTLVAYMDVMRLYQSAKNPLSDEEVLSRYDQISQALQHEKGAEEKQAMLDKLLAATVQLNCQLIEEKFGKPFLAHLEDTAKAKKIVALGLAYQCKDQPFFLEAARIMQQNSPSFGLAKLIAALYDAQHQAALAEQYYQQAADLTQEASQKADVLYGLAVHYQREEQKEKARAAALQAVAVDPSRKEAYKLIGDLYFSSFTHCKGGSSQVKDRAVYIAAYEMYQRAGRADLMAQAKQQFPSIEDIFQEGLKEGETVKAGCWIQEEVKLKRRGEVQ